MSEFYVVKFNEWPRADMKNKLVCVPQSWKKESKTHDIFYYPKENLENINELVQNGRRPSDEIFFSYEVSILCSTDTYENAMEWIKRNMNTITPNAGDDVSKDSSTDSSINTVVDCSHSDSNTSGPATSTPKKGATKNLEKGKKKGNAKNETKSVNLSVSENTPKTSKTDEEIFIDEDMMKSFENLLISNDDIIKNIVEAYLNKACEQTSSRPKKLSIAQKDALCAYVNFVAFNKGWKRNKGDIIKRVEHFFKESVKHDQ